MQTYDSPLFTPTEAAALTQLSVKAVNNAIDKKTVPAAIGRRAGQATRLLDLRALMSLTLERRLADRFVPGLRRELFDALTNAQRNTVSLEGGLTQSRFAGAAARTGYGTAPAAPRTSAGCR